MITVFALLILALIVVGVISVLIICNTITISINKHVELCSKEFNDYQHKGGIV